MPFALFDWNSENRAKQATSNFVSCMYCVKEISILINKCHNLIGY